MASHLGAERLGPWLRACLRRVVLPAAVRAVGRRDAVRLAGFLSNELRFDGPNDMRSNGELLVQDCVVRNARGRMTVLDVGANVGDWTLAFAAKADAVGRVDYTIHAFEPSSTTARLLNDRLAGQPCAARVVVHEFGMSSSPGVVTFHIVGEGLGVNSVHRPLGDPVIHTEQVKMATLDHFAADEHLGYLTLVKVDTEGHDLSVIVGAHDLLERGAIAVMQFEYNQRWIASRTYLRDVFEAAPRRYRIGKITRKGIEWYARWHTELESYRENNYLLCRDDVADWFPAVPWWKE